MKHGLKPEKNKYLLISLLFFLQLAFVHAYLPIGEWFSPDAIYTDDFSFHYGHVLEKTNYLKESGKIWGYNPFLRAGSITNANTTIDNNGCVLFCFVLFFLPVEISFKLYFILGIAIVPILCYKAARNFDFSSKTALLSSFLGTILMHVSVMVNFIYWGTISFIFASYISILAVSYFYRFCSIGNLKNLACFTLLTAVALWIHAFTTVILSVPLLTCYVISFRRMRGIHHLSILASLLFVALCNIPWIYPLLLFLDQIVRDHTAFFYAPRSLIEPLHTYLFRNNLFNSYMNMVFDKEEWVDILLLLSSILGIYQLSKTCKHLAVLLFGFAAFLFLLSYYGSFFEITTLTNMRFLITLNILLVFPSALGFEYLYRLFLDSKSLKIKAVFSAVVVYLLINLVATPYYHLFYKKDFRLVYQVPEPFTQMIEWIKNNTTQEGRILVENSDFESEHQYYGTHLPFLLPIWTKREYIGIYSFYAASKDSFTSYNNGILFRKPISSYSQEELFPYLELYNINWIIYWSEESKEVFESNHQLFTPLIRIDKFNICKVKRDASFFIKGSGTVRSDYNKIYLEKIQPVDGEIIISYHWMKYLKTESPRTLEKILLLQDPSGFIKIKDSPPDLLIYNDY